MVSQARGPFPLPQELLEEIFKNLDVESVLSLRMTCRAFCAATTSTWLHLAREIHSRPQHPRSEEPLEDYTPEELQDWVLRRHRAEQFWNAPSIAHDPCVRAAEGIVHHSTVLPGGRWFLSMNGSGEVMAVDMDSSKLESKPLVTVSHYIEGTEIEDCPGWFTVWADPRTHRLTFRIALINPESPRMHSNPEGRSRVHIFQARLLGHGKYATLIAEPFRRFEGSLSRRVVLAALSSRYFIQVEETLTGEFGEEGDFSMYVFDCEMECSTRLKLRSFDYPMLVDFFIPSDDKVVIQTTKSILIYTIPTHFETLRSEPMWHPTHTISCIPPSAQPCKPHIGENSTTIMYLLRRTTTCEVIALEVPHNTPEAHRATCVAEFLSYPTEWQTVGHFGALGYQTGSSRCCLSFSKYLWDPLSDEGPRSVRFSSHSVDIPPSITFPFERCSFGDHLFHESIGRLVLVSDEEDAFYVYDLIPARSSKAMDDG